MVSRGQIPVVELGGKVLFDPDDLYELKRPAISFAVIRTNDSVSVVVSLQSNNHFARLVVAFYVKAVD